MTFRLLHLMIAMLVSCFGLAQGVSETPAAAALRIRREDAQKRPLFQSADPLQLNLEAKFGVLTKDRDPDIANVYPGVIRMSGAGTGTIELPITISVRGNLRRKTCEFVPLRIAFSRDAAKGTVFELRGVGLKLVTHCQNSSKSDQYILREYLAYRIANIVTPRSFRARLARVTY